jgi:hypothetical protein
MASLDESENSILYFVINDVKIPVDYNTIKTYSNLVEVISEDDPNAREVVIPNFKEYRNEDIIAHLGAILDKLGKTMKVDTGTFSNDDLEIGIHKVPGSLDNLIIWLLLTNWLDIRPLFQEIVDTLLMYTPLVDNISKYLNISESILRSPEIETKFQKRVLDFLLDNNQPLLDPNINMIMNKIINNVNLDLYSRHVLAIKYSLYGITSPKDEVDEIVARRLYNLNIGINLQIIKDEIPRIEKTKKVIADSISKYGLAIRVSPSINASKYIGGIKINEKPDPDFFWFYIQRKHHNKVYVGDVTVNNTVYKIYLQVRHLYTIDEFKSNELIQHNVDYTDLEMYQTIYDDDELKIISENDNGYNKFILFQREDTKYRQWLDTMGMLSDFEKSMLPLRIEAISYLLYLTSLQAKIDNLFHDIENYDGYDSDSDYDENNNDHVELKRMKDELRNVMDEHNGQSVKIKDKVVAIYNAEKAFYFSEDGKKLEEARQSFRIKFFEGETLYAGEVAIFDFFEVLEITNDEIVISPITASHEMFHTIKVNEVSNSNKSKVTNHYNKVAIYNMRDNGFEWYSVEGIDEEKFSLDSCSIYPNTILFK